MFLYILLFLPNFILGSNITGSPLWDNILIRCSDKASFSCVQNQFRSYIETSLQGDLNITDSVSFIKNQNQFVWSGKPKIIKDPNFSNFIDSVEESENEIYPEEKNEIAEKSRVPRLNVFGLADLFYNKGIGYLMNHDLHVSLPSFLGGGTLSVSPKSLDEDGALVKLKYTQPQVEEENEVDKPTGRIFIFKRIKKFINRKLLTSFLAALLIIALIKIKLLFFFPLVLGVGAAKKLLLKVLLFLFPALAHLFKLCAFYHHHHTKYHHHHHQVAHHHHHVPVHVPTYHDVPEYLDHPPPGWHNRMGDPPTNVELEQWGIEHDDTYQPPNYSTRRTNPTSSTRYQDSLNLSPNIKVYDNNNNVKGTLSMGSPIYDPFYTPILAKLDEIFNQLGFTEEGCKERLVCSMYKAPDRFSPHSNLVSAQLSRDASELQKPSYSNPAVQRFYKYVQAARDGQDMKSCLVLYPSCSVITE